MNRNEIGNRIRIIREEKHLSEDAFLEKVFGKNAFFSKNFTSGMLSKIENGTYLPPVELLYAIDQKQFGTSDQILFGEELLPVWELQEILGQLKNEIFDKFINILERVLPQPKWDTSILEDENLSLCSLRFREIRKAMGLNQSEMANRLGVSKNTVYSNEKLVDYPKTQYLLNFCIKNKCSSVYLLDTFESLPYRLQVMQVILSAYSYQEQRIMVQKYKYFFNRHFGNYFPKK